MKIGKIISVEYDRFRVRLFTSTKTSTKSIDGNVYYFGNIGSYVRTFNSIGNVIICEVIAVVDNNVDNKTYTSFNLDSSRELLIKPIGIINQNNVFSMGVGIFPSLYNDVEIVTKEELNMILSPCLNDINEEKGIHRTINIGYSKSLINYNISLDINKLFNIHTAVLGNSGSGKSNTIAHILQEVFRKNNNHAHGSKIILFDVNGEYPSAFTNAGLSTDIKTIFYKPNIDKEDFKENKISYNKFILPYYLMNLDEWLAFLMASDRTQKPFWDRVLQECYKFYMIFNDDKKADTYINYFKWKILKLLESVLSHVDSDTVRITAARSVIMRCKSLISEIKISPEELIRFLVDMESNCEINYGNNNKQLENYISNAWSDIDIDSAIKIDSLKLNSGNYYDYKFLQISVEITLLEEEARGNTRVREFTSTLLTRLDFFLNNPECNFMRESGIEYKNKEHYLKETFGIFSDNSKQLITIDTSEVSSDILELMTSVVSRMIFDIKKSKQGEARRKQPIHLILDEAHRYIHKDTTYILRENIFEKIAREGRKYSLYLIISSQRPSELSGTVLSQCGNYIVHRIQNEIDMRYIYSVLPYFSEDYISKIKQSVPGEALIFGNCVPLPLQVKITQAKPDPNSENCNISKEWFANIFKKNE